MGLLFIITITFFILFILFAFPLCFCSYYSSEETTCCERCGCCNESQRPPEQQEVIYENEAVHLVMRGGNKGPNYSPEHIAAAEQALLATQGQPSIMVDCSHANSEKDHK